MTQDKVQFYRMCEDSREMLNLIAQSKPVAPRKGSDKPARKTSATRAQYRRASDASPELFQLREDDSRFACNRVISNAQTSAEGYVNPKHRRRSQSDAGIQRKTTPSPQELSSHSRRLIAALKENPAEAVDTSLPRGVLRRGSAPAAQILGLKRIKEEDESENKEVDAIKEEVSENVPNAHKMSIRQKLSVFFKGNHSQAQRA